MRRHLIVTAAAGFVGMAACCASASAGEYIEGRYRAYERHREAIDRYRANAEERAYKREMAYQSYLARQRDRASRRDRDDGYERYSSPYRHYSNHGWHYYGYSYGYGYGYDPSESSYYNPTDPHWKPELYPTGDRQWWSRMNREGRGGQQ